MRLSDFASRLRISETGLIGLQCRRKVALRRLHVAAPFVQDREIALPKRVLGVGLRQRREDGDALLERSERAFEIALRDLNVANALMGDRQLTLRVAVIGIGFGEPVSDREALLERFESFGKMTLRHLYVADLDVRNRKVGLRFHILRL